MADKLTQYEIDSLKGRLTDFISYYEESVADTRECRELILDYFDLIFVETLPNYYNNNYNTIRPEMNALMDIMSMGKFVKVFKSILEDEEIEDFPKYRGVVGETLSVLVECNHNVMSEDTVNTYTWTIMRRLWSKEISALKRDFNITEEFALELLINIPTHPNNMSHIQLERFTSNFKNAIMNHTVSSENLDVLGTTTMGRLLDFFFDKESKLQLNALGKLLGKHADTVEEISKWQGPVYSQYTRMLYTKLNKFDIKDIKYVLKYIASKNKKYAEHNESNALFDIESAYDFRNIKIAVSKLIEEDPSLKKYL